RRAETLTQSPREADPESERPQRPHANPGKAPWLPTCTPQRAIPTWRLCCNRRPAQLRLGKQPMVEPLFSIPLLFFDSVVDPVPPPRVGRPVPQHRFKRILPLAASLLPLC